MNAETHGVWYEHVAAIASLGALFFLLWQNILLQKQSKELSHSIRSATYQNIVGLYMDINKLLAVDSNMADAYESFDDENKNEDISFERKRMWLAWWLLNHYENAYMQYNIGALPDYMWKGISRDCISHIKKGYILKLWEQSKDLYSDKFMQFVESQK